MSKLDEYKEAKREHEEMCSILGRCKATIGSVSQYSSAHHVEFMFRQEGKSQEYRTRLATMLGKACGIKVDELVETAKRLSEADVAEKAQAAQDEAVETLKTVRVEQKGEDHATEKS